MSKRSRRTAVCNTLHATRHTSTRYPKRYHHRQGEPVHLRVMEGNYTEFRNRETIKHSLPSANRQTNRENERDSRTILTLIHQLPTRQLERSHSHRGVCIQQWISRNNQDNTVLCKLRKKSQTSVNEPHDHGQRNNCRKYGNSSPNITRRNEECTDKTKRKL